MGYFDIVSGLYIHVPFCQVKCRYCAFAVFPGLRAHTGRYLQTLRKEMARYYGRTIDTIYFGGGTPSLLPIEQWLGMMGAVQSNFILKANTEITVECNPENINFELVRSYLDAGVNRISLGLQTSQNSLLKKIGRTHLWEDFLKAYSACRSAGIKNISVDLIFGLPGQTMSEWQETLIRVLDLEPEHLSLYPLDVEKKSAFYFDGVTADQNLQADMYEQSLERIESFGFEHYEVFSYAMPGRQCRHNIKYWKNSPCIGIGLSAAGYDGNLRAHNTDHFWNYIESVESGESPMVSIERLAPLDRLREKIMLGLRMKEGLIFTEEINSAFGQILERLEAEGTLRILQDPQEGKKITPTLKGWLLSNYIYRELLR